MQQLKVGSSLQGGKYKIEKVLGQGGFGITYLATQELLDRKVCIKEFFFKEYCERDEATSHVTLGTQSNHELVERFMAKFLKEARTISQLNHPHIIRIYDIFKENNTAYYVMEYIEGMSLAELVNRQGALPEDVAIRYIKQVATALDFVHQHSINHLDVKPANIMLRKEDDQVVLIDFGLSKQYDAQGGQTSTTPVGISHGYAPMEQYNVGGVSVFSPQTDIYSMGATLYKLVIGQTPPQAGEVLNEGLPEFPSSISLSVAETIKKAMQPRKVDRPSNINQFIDLLKNIYQNSSFESTSKQDIEETRILSNINLMSEAKEEGIVENIQLQEISSTKNINNNKKKKRNKVGYSLLFIFSLFMLFFIFKDGNHKESLGIESIPSDELYEQALSYMNKTEYDKAIPLLKKAAKDSIASASYSLGWCYENGMGVPKSIKKAKEWYMEAANGGVVDAFDALGWLNYEQKQYDVAFYFWKAGAEKENANAQFNLGLCYYNGLGTKQNFTEAGYWWRKSGLQGHAKAQLSIGDIYYYGEGTPKNNKEAFEWWLKSAEQGYAEAQYKLGYCYHYGTIDEQDSQKAKQWLLLASNQGHEDAKKLLEEIDSQINNRKVAKILINGYVGDVNGPIIGASVVEKGTNNGTITDLDGKFSLTVNSDAIVCVGFIGYKTKERSAQKNMSFTLVEE